MLALSIEPSAMFSECAQSGDFLYLTGISQSGALAAITAGSGGSAPHFTLFTPSIEPERERWDGARLRPEAAAEVFGADEAYPTTEVPSSIGIALWLRRQGIRLK